MSFIENNNKHGQPAEDIDKTLHIAMSWTQYSAGAGGLYPIQSETLPDLSYVKGRTIIATRKFLNECNGVIHLDKTYVQHPKHINDVSIMHSEHTNNAQSYNESKGKDQLCSNVSRGKLCK